MRNIRIFLEQYPQTRVIILEKNYRSKEEIIELSRSIMTPSAGLHTILPSVEKHYYADR